MQRLPIELVSHIFGFIPTKELYPSCFILSKNYLQALMDELVWMKRCQQELFLDDKDNSLSWFQTYKGNLTPWIIIIELNVINRMPCI